MRGQVLLRLSLTEQTNDLLKKRAAKIGVTVTQYAKHIIVHELDRLEGIILIKMNMY